VNIELKFEPRDLWVGLFWDRRSAGLWQPMRTEYSTHFYVCVIPTLVVHVWFTRTELREPDAGGVQ
jgi:hypothetical protein